MTAVAALLALLSVTARAFQDASAPEEVALTIGADGTSVVREVRSAQLNAGECRLRVFDVSPQLVPETVSLRALSDPDRVELKQQSVWFEILDAGRALEKLAGRPVNLVRYHESGIEKLEGRLLFPPIAPGPNGEVQLPLYLEQPDGLIRQLEGGEIELDALPPGDWNRLRLDWRLACARADRYRFELLYATRGLKWRADYVLRVGADGTTADLSAFATVENATGVAWRSVRLEFAERETAERVIPWRLRSESAERANALVHPIADAVTIDARTTTQIALASKHELAVKSVPTLFLARDSSGGRLAIVRRYDVVDAPKSVGRALPAGTARVIVVDAKNRPNLAGTTSFAAAAASDPLSFAAEALPGLAAESSRSRVAKSGKDVQHVVVKFWNERDEKIEVEALEPLELAEIVEDANFPADRSRPDTARFTVPLLPRSSTTLEWNVVRP